MYNSTVLGNTTAAGTGLVVAAGTTVPMFTDGTNFSAAGLPAGGATTGTGSLVFSASPTFTGAPLAPTANAGTNTTQIATTAFVNSAVTTATGSLGTMSTQNASAVTITGGSITGITDLAVADGGTGVSTLAANSVLLGNGTSAIQTVAPSTSGNVLTSNGTTWASTANPKIGVGQTWQNVTGSRTRGTTYTNSTGAPIMVCICAQAGGGPSPYQAEGYVDGSIVTQATCAFDTSALSFIVPNGSTYKYDGTAFGIQLWTELR
jgi:hypothetical protein